MFLDHDDSAHPELGAFRRACLAADTETMEAIARKQHDWYANENPDALPMEKLALIFQAQYYASENQADELRDLLQEHDWVANHSWTAQGWLPLSQAAFCRHREAVEVLLEFEADPTRMVGSPDDRASIVDMAQAGGHQPLAELLAAANKS